MIETSETNAHGPLVSIIVPIYNVEQYLPRCLDSIINQSYRNLEIILVNDGSSDNSLAICKQYQKRDSRIRLVDKKNGGLGSARNAGIDVMKGEYVAFFDSDDYVASNIVERLLLLSKKHNAEIAVCRFCTFNENDKPKPNINGNVHCYSSSEALFQMFVPKSIGWGAWNKIYKSDLFSDVRYGEGIYDEDMATSYLLYGKCQNVVQTDDELYYYFIRYSGIMRSKPPKRYVDAIDNIEKIIHYFDENIPGLSDVPRAFYAEIAPNCLAALVNSGEYIPYQEKSISAIKQFGKLALRERFVKKQFKFIIACLFLLFTVDPKAHEKYPFKIICHAFRRFIR